MLNPLGLINDGLMELVFYKQILGVQSALNLFKGTKSGGVQFYDNNFTCYRAKNVKLTNFSKQ